MPETSYRSERKTVAGGCGWTGVAETTLSILGSCSLQNLP